MAKNLVIVESPAKAKTIEGYLGSDYVVKASIGHVRDLPKNNFAVSADGNFDVTYEIYPDSEKVVSELKKLAKDAIKDDKFVW
jgi:DNA topoisomerase-1